MSTPETGNAMHELSFGGEAYTFECDWERHRIKWSEITEIHPEERYAVLELDRGTFKHCIFCNLAWKTISLFHDFDVGIGTENCARAPTADSVTARFSPKCLDGRDTAVSYLRHSVSGQVDYIITDLEEHPDNFNPRPTWNPAHCSAGQGRVYEMLQYAGIIYETPNGEFTLFRGIFDTIVRKGREPGEYLFAKLAWTKTPVNIEIAHMIPGWIWREKSSVKIPVKYYEKWSSHDGVLNLETMEITPTIILQTLERKTQTIPIWVEDRASTWMREGDE